MFRLVPFTADHFPLISGWFSNQAEVVQWGGPFLRYPLTDDQLEGMLALGLRKPPSRLCWMIGHGQDLMGHAQLGLDWHNGNAMLSRVAVAPEFRGKGLAAPMLAPVIERAFDFPEMERLELNVFDWNLPAIRTYEKLGFTLEGVRRSSARAGDERWNTAIMGLLRAEWSQAAT